MRVGNLLKSTIWLPAAWSLPANNIPMFGMMKQMDTRGK
nr:Uncharacterised protein [Klebsiella pneumoniae]